MNTFFWFAVFCQLIAGVVAIATIGLYTRGVWPLALTALFSGCCPPLQQWFYGVNLTSSEIVSIVPVSLMGFALAKGFLAYRSSPISHGWRSLSWNCVGWFAIAGALIGVHSLIRDSGATFATFLALFVVGRAIVADRKRVLLAISIGAVLIAGATAVRQPVRMWNKQRIGAALVCGSSEGSVWRYGLWLKHDAFDWYETSGIGLGEYLNPEGAHRVEAYYSAGRPRPQLFSLCTLIEGMIERPRDALSFKASRLPVLWLGTNRWPHAELSLVSGWCLAFYGGLAALVAARWWRQRYIPEPIYVYLLLIVAASSVIHYEFRYTFPIWQTLILTPGLLLATYLKNGWRDEVSLPSQAVLDPIGSGAPGRESIAA